MRATAPSNVSAESYRVLINALSVLVRSLFIDIMNNPSAAAETATKSAIFLSVYYP